MFPRRPGAGAAVCGFFHAGQTVAGYDTNRGSFGKITVLPHPEEICPERPRPIGRHHLEQYTPSPPETGTAILS
jgi:hypothetical protein